MKPIERAADAITSASHCLSVVAWPPIDVAAKVAEALLGDEDELERVVDARGCLVQSGRPSPACDHDRCIIAAIRAHVLDLPNDSVDYWPSKLGADGAA